jgi:hypothetical protein
MAMEPSKAFNVFLKEASEFEIVRGLNLDFDAKQRMLARVEGFAVREAYTISVWRLWVPGQIAAWIKGLKDAEQRLVEAESKITAPIKREVSGERHRAEIVLCLYARTIQQFTQRRLYTIAAAASVAAVLASAAAVVVALVTSRC